MQPPVYAVEVDNVRFGYTDKLFLKDVSFRIEKGDFAAIIGDNGSGKSTMVKLILGLLEPISGTLQVMGQPVSKGSRPTSVGYVPQSSGDSVARFPASAEEIVLSSLYRRIGPFRFAGRKHRQIARDAIEQAGLTELIHKLPSEMSGGQRQRLMLARVLANRPEILILDEPTVGIDTDAVDRLLSVLHDINIHSGTTILMVTHDIAKIAAFSNRVLCLSEKHFSENDLPEGTVVHIHPLTHDHMYEHIHCANCEKSHDPDKCEACDALRKGGAK
jgi:zinc transport system ATP-binding protein